MASKVWITLDFLDGTSKIKQAYPDEIDLTGLLFRLIQRDLASITFTTVYPLDYLKKHCEQEFDRIEKHIEQLKGENNAKVRR